MSLPTRRTRCLAVFDEETVTTLDPDEAVDILIEAARLYLTETVEAGRDAPRWPLRIELEVIDSCSVPVDDEGRADPGADVWVEDLVVLQIRRQRPGIGGL